MHTQHNVIPNFGGNIDYGRIKVRPIGQGNELQRRLQQVYQLAFRRGNQMKHNDQDQEEEKINQ
mgnify:CR=1 FL=1